MTPIFIRHVRAHLKACILETKSAYEINALLDCVQRFEGLAKMATSPSPKASKPVVPREETPVKFTLVDCGHQKIQVIKLVRELTGLGLKEAKDACDNVPTRLWESLDDATAKENGRRFTAVGAAYQLS